MLEDPVDGQHPVPGWLDGHIDGDCAGLQALQAVQIVAPLGIPVLDLLLADLLLLVHEQWPEDDGPTRTIQLLGFRSSSHIPALAAVRPEQVRLGRIVGVEGAQEVKVRPGLQAIRLGKGRAVAELVGRLNVQQGVGHLLLLGRGSCICDRCQDHQDHRAELQRKEKEGKQSDIVAVIGRCE